VIAGLSEGLLKHYQGKPLIDAYDVYQHLMDYWGEAMQDDCYLIAADGWKAETYRVLVKNSKGREVDKGWACDLVPKPLVVARYFAREQAPSTSWPRSWRPPARSSPSWRRSTAVRTGPLVNWRR